jgi:hypothetical protein
MHMRARTLLVAVVAAAFMLGGCGAGVRFDGRGLSPVSVPAWTTAATPVSQPYSVAGRVVAYTVRDERLYLVGIDPPTGTIAWEREASLGWLNLDAAARPALIGDRVAYLRPAPGPNKLAELVLADPRTGADVAKTGVAVFTGVLSACANGADVCTMSAPKIGTKTVPMRLVAATGRFERDGTDADTARVIGERGLVELGTRPAEVLALRRDGRIVWKRPLAEAFPGDASTDGGWRWTHVPEQRLYVGSVWKKPAKAGGWYSRDLATGSATAALSEETGQVLWRDDGSWYGCAGIDVPPGAGVRCRYRGTVRFTDEETQFDGLNVTLEGFDLATGRTVWSRDVGAVGGLAGDRTPGAYPPVAGDGQITVPVDDTLAALDLRTGRTRVVGGDEPLWCWRSTRYEFREPYRTGDGRTAKRRSGGAALAVCNRAGAVAEGRPRWTATRWVGVEATVDRHVVVATKDGFQGYTRN